MKTDTWIKHIKEACEAAGTYRPFFDDTIETLAAVLEKRDDAEKEYQRTGAKPVVEFVNNTGHQNIVKNPILAVVDQLNTTALAYWRDLGLTPAGLKRINENAMKKKKESGLAAALRSMDG